MHEFSLIKAVIDTILEQLKNQEGSPAGSPFEVFLKVGALELHSAKAARQAYQVLVKGTILEHSRLHLEMEPVILDCPKCGFKGPLPEGRMDPHDSTPLAECPACGSVSQVLGGRGVSSMLIWE